MTVFGCPILNSIYFSGFSLALIEDISNTQDSDLTTVPNTSKFVKNTPLRVAFIFLFSLFRNEVKHSPSCSIYYIDNSVCSSNKDIRRL